MLSDKKLDCTAQTVKKNVLTVLQWREPIVDYFEGRSPRASVGSARVRCVEGQSFEVSILRSHAGSVGNQ